MSEPNERVVVVGGTSGIGLAVAERQLREGGEVVVTGRDKARLDAALQQLGERATGVAVDPPMSPPLMPSSKSRDRRTMS